MAHTFIQMLQQLTALIVGGAIGVGFGMVQDYARDFYVPSILGTGAADDPPTG